MAKQKPPVPVRLSDELLYKFDVVCQHKRRRRGELLRLLAEDEVAAYEKEHGPIVLAADMQASQKAGG